MRGGSPPTRSTTRNYINVTEVKSKVGDEQLRWVTANAQYYRWLLLLLFFLFIPPPPCRPPIRACVGENLNNLVGEDVAAEDDCQLFEEGRWSGAVGGVQKS
eukprot:Sspe_Gene.62048::Locus_34619_Transcript_2_5_Confidence_0.333_Length_587::g.62048::m.62048